MTLWQAVLFGLLQGVTEFLPVSSSGHLVLLRRLVDVEPPGAFVETALHLGTLIAVLAVYAPHILRLVRSLKRRGPGSGWPVLRSLAVATVPAGLLGVLAERALTSRFGDPGSAAWGLVGTTCLLLSLVFVAPRHPASAPRDPTARSGALPAPGPAQSLFVGLFQALALLPGVSRSGATIVAGRWAGLAPEDSAAFSFLLSLPAVAGAAVLEGAQYGGTVTRSVDIRLLILACLIAAVTGYLALRLVLRLVASERLWLFAPYTLTVAGVALLWLRIK